MTSIVYPYEASMARGNELRYSLRSLEVNFCGPVEVWLVGDRPDWYTGYYLPCPKYDSNRILPRQDRAKKMFRAVDEVGIDEEFLWMMDDIYFIRPTHLSDLKRPWVCGHADPLKLDTWKPVTEWGRQKQQTWWALRENGRPMWDFATHLPHVYRKSNLLELDKLYFMRECPLVDDLLYENHFMPYGTDVLPVKDILYRETRRPSAVILARRLDASGALVFNHVDRSFSSAVELLLSQKFPRPSRWEH